MSDTIYLQFIPGEQVGSAMIQQAQGLYDAAQRLRYALDDLYGSGLHGAFMSQFTTRNQDLLAMMRTLTEECDESGRDLLTVVQWARDLDADCAQRFDSRETIATLRAAGFVGLPASMTLDEFKSQPWYQPDTIYSQRDGGWNGADPSVARAIVVNGIQTDQAGLQGLMQGASEEMGGAPVMGIYNATYGANNPLGIAGDVVQSAGDKMQVVSASLAAPLYDLFGYSAPTNPLNSLRNPAISSLKEAIKDTNGDVTVYAHSQGGIITSAALWELHNEGYDLSRLNVVTMGSAEFNFPSGGKFDPQYEHRVNQNDLVPMLAGGQAVHCVFNPVTLERQILTGEVRIQNYGIGLPDAHSSQNYYGRY